MYEAGYLHRDVSIGNVLKLKKPKECKRFTTKGVYTLLERRPHRSGPSRPDLADEFKQGLRLEEEPSWDRLREIAGDDADCVILVDAAHELEDAIARLGVSTTECQAIICDGDMAVHIPTYFDNGTHGGDISVSSRFFFCYGWLVG